jgi:hypothetical protein
MRQRIALTLEKEVFCMLKRKRINISRFVEKLILKEVSGRLMDDSSVTQVPDKPKAWMRQNLDSERNLGRAIKTNVTL